MRRHAGLAGACDDYSIIALESIDRIALGWSCVTDRPNSPSLVRPSCQTPAKRQTDKRACPVAVMSVRGVHPMGNGAQCFIEI